MRKILLIILLMCRQAMAQDKELTIGDQFPEMDFQNVINYMKPVIESEELKDKIILIDFWATHCGSCVSNMPKMAKLQEEFKDDLKVILVTYQERALVEKFYAKRPEFKALNLPVVCSDTLMLERFPYRAMPQLVWIGKDRLVKAVTFAEYATRENIRTLIDKNVIKLPLKHDLVNFDYDHYFPKTELAATEVLQQSKLTGYIGGIGGRTGFVNLEDDQFRVYAINFDVMHLLYMAIEHRFRPNISEYTQRMILETKKKELFQFYEDREIEKSNQYCYEVGMKGKSNAENRIRLCKKMQADVESAFGIRATVEKREVDCYVLKSIGEHAATPGKKLLQHTVDSIQFRNVPGSSVAIVLYNLLKADIPIVFEGNAADVYSLVLAQKYADVSALYSSLNKAGLHLEKGRREMEMLVVRDE